MIDQSRVPSAFPALLAELHASLKPGQLAVEIPLAVLRVEGQEMTVPYRVYYDPAKLWSVVDRSSGLERSLALCLGSRHWDGHVREACVRRLLPSRDRWVVPFVVCLLGEYVIEIIDLIADAFDGLDPDALADFASENRAFLATTISRATSYWNERFRQRFPDRQAYPALAMLAKIDRVARPARRRRLGRATRSCSFRANPPSVSVSGSEVTRQ
jgi:hypothetical protein